MTLRLRHLELRAVTAEGTFGTSLDFSNGLNVLRADNSSGKSTCMQAVIYALGLEGMLSPRRVVPLPHAMTDAIEIDGAELPVLESWVALEIQNGAGEVITVRRAVKSADKSQALMQTTLRRGAAADGQGVVVSRDYFVGRSGGAQREAGFHNQLARFLGWELPRVTRNDGSEGLLYLECLFPYFYVEQKRGWSGAQARVPTHYQIRDVGKRSAEFVLKLDAYGIVLQRQRLESAASIMQSEWRDIVAQLKASAHATGAVARGQFERATTHPDTVIVEAVIPADSDWHSIDEEITRQQDRLEELSSRPVQTVGDSSDELEENLNRAGDELTALMTVLQEAVAAQEETKARVKSLDIRVSVLEEDVQRHKDAAVLRRLGADHVELLPPVMHCPTCEQELADGFDITSNPMSEDENIVFIEDELKTYRAMRTDALRTSEVEEVRVERLRAGAAELRRRVRTLKDMLVAPSSMPSIEDATERLRVEERLAALQSLRDELALAAIELRSRASQLHDNRQMLAKLETGLSHEDKKKLDHLEESFKQQLQQYGFSSVTPASLEISLDTYRPIHEGFDLGFDLSASDMIRVIWAYLLGILETGQAYSTNHPLLLLFDEPRQQETSSLSFEALLSRAGSDGAAGAQIVFATSEEEDSLRRMLADVPHRLISFPPGEKILARIEQ